MQWWSGLCSQVQTILNEIHPSAAPAKPYLCSAYWSISLSWLLCTEVDFSHCEFRPLAFQIYFIDSVSSFISLPALL